LSSNQIDLRAEVKVNGREIGEVKANTLDDSTKLLYLQISQESYEKNHNKCKQVKELKLFQQTIQDDVSNYTYATAEKTESLENNFSQLTSRVDHVEESFTNKLNNKADADDLKDLVDKQINLKMI